MQPFRPVAAATVNIDVSSSTGSVKVADARGPSAIRVMNNGTATAWIAFGGPSITASLTTSTPVGPGVTEVLYAQNGDGSDLWAAAIAAGSTGKIYFTPGSGI